MVYLVNIFLVIFYFCYLFQINELCFIDIFSLFIISLFLYGLYRLFLKKVIINLLKIFLSLGFFVMLLESRLVRTFISWVKYVKQMRYFYLIFINLRFIFFIRFFSKISALGLTFYLVAIAFSLALLGLFLLVYKFHQIVADQAVKTSVEVSIEENLKDEASYSKISEIPKENLPEALNKKFPTIFSTEAGYSKMNEIPKGNLHEVLNEKFPTIFKIFPTEDNPFY